MGLTLAPNNENWIWQQSLSHVAKQCEKLTCRCQAAYCKKYYGYGGSSCHFVIFLELPVWRTGLSLGFHKGFLHDEAVYRKSDSGLSCKVNKSRESQPEEGGWGIEHGQTAGNWPLLNTPRGSDEMRQERLQFGEQGINPGGLIGGLACFKGPCCTHLPVPMASQSWWAVRDGWPACWVWSTLEQATGY